MNTPEMKRNRNKKILKITVSTLTVFLSLWALQRLLVPKYRTSFTEGALIQEYYTNEGGYDVLFVGDCEICTAFSPPYLWEKYGINSFVRGSIQQTIWQTYYLLEEMLQKETPKVVVFNVAAMKYGESLRGAYNRMTLDGMRWSPYKVMAVKESLTEDENFWEYIFPILCFHGRWKELGKEDFNYFFDRESQFFNGYWMHTEIRSYQAPQYVFESPTKEFDQRCYTYLDKIRLLCEAEGIDLILLKGPGILPAWYSEWDRQMEEYAQENGLLYVNILHHIYEIGIDYEVDTFSKGRHMNVTGAEKVSEFMGKILQDFFHVPDRRNEKVLAEEWQKKIEKYEEKKGERRVSERNSKEENSEDSGCNYWNCGSGGYDWGRC